MQHTAGNYEAFVKARPAEHAQDTRAWIVGSGLAGLAAAVFLVRDGGVPGENVTVVEKGHLPGGALDGLDVPEKGFVIRGGRELENHMECLWDMMRSVPSLEIEGASVLDEFAWLNRDDPNYSLRRATVKRGQDAGHEGKFDLPQRAQKDLLHVFLATREEMEGKRIQDVMSKEFLASPFWMYWRTMFAFEEWHSALEFKLYLHRFVHHIGGLPDFSALKFSKYNQYESFVLPLIKYLTEKGVTFQYDTDVRDIDFSHRNGEIRATAIHWTREGAKNFAFLGQFAETGRDCIFTTEYSVRTGMEAVYELLDLDRGVPETWGSTYDVRVLLDALTRLRDGEKVRIPGPEPLRKRLRRRLEDGEIGELLEEYGVM